MNSKMHFVLEGLPERVQEAADALDRAFPGLISWRRFAEQGRDYTVRLEGDAAEWSGRLLRPAQLTSQTAASGEAWKLNPATGRVFPRRGAFCASLSKSLLP